MSEMNVQSVDGKPAALAIKDAEVCISCQIVKETAKGTGLKGFYCDTCHKTFQKNLKHWNRHGLFVTKRKKDEHEALHEHLSYKH
jgi:hypothetical protein